MLEDTQLMNSLKDTLLAEGLQISEIDSKRNYWFIRTQGGSYFDEFLGKNFVAIGWDDVPCLEQSERTQDIFDKLHEADYGMPGRVLNQVYRFCTELKKGDVVVIPSESSLSFAFGYIDGDVYTVSPSKEDIESGKCPFTRRRKTKWVTGIPRNRVDPKLYAFFRNQQALSSANDQAEFIDRAISSFYIKNNIAHLTLSVEIEKSPRANDIPHYMHGILARTYSLATALKLIPEDDEDADLDCISSRINVQSDGIIELLGNPVFVFLVALVVIALFGGKATFRQKSDTTNIDVKTDGLPGLIKTISKVFSDHKQDKYIGDEKLKKIQSRLQIKDPREK